jgi:MoxR-like ATPase
MHDDPPAVRSMPLPDASARAARVVKEVGRALTGKDEAIALAVTALVARGHLLIEDVPGVGKTTLARALAKAVGVPFARLSCTSDLLPADVLGGSVYLPQAGGGSSLVFRAGPVFTSVLLADELNRATPRTQSALLEAMEERRVTIEGETRPLPEPFFVIATQNPEELHGTYPLPESQLDRFLLRISLGHPDRKTERALLVSRRDADPVAALAAVLDPGELLAIQRASDEVRVDEAIVDYLHEVVLETRKSPVLAQGASTRAVLATMRAIRAHAVVCGRAFATPDDAQALVLPALAHRVRAAGDAGRAEAERAICEILGRIPVPT